MADVNLLCVPHTSEGIHFPFLDETPSRDITPSPQLSEDQRELIPFSGYSNELDDEGLDLRHFYNYCHSRYAAPCLNDLLTYNSSEFLPSEPKPINRARHKRHSQERHRRAHESANHQVLKSDRSSQHELENQEALLPQANRSSYALRKQYPKQPKLDFTSQSYSGGANIMENPDFTTQTEDMLSRGMLRTGNSDCEDEAGTGDEQNLVALRNLDALKSTKNNNCEGGKETLALVKVAPQDKNSNAHETICRPNLVQEGLHRQDDSLLNPSQIECLLSFAAAHGTPGDMIDHCKMALLSSDYNTLINNYLTAVRYQLFDVMDKLIDLIRRNFECVSQTQQFLALPVDIVIMFLEDDQLDLANELEVFFAALSWIDYNKQERLACAGRVLNCVRYVHIDPIDLIEYVEPNINLFTGLDGLQALVNMYRYQALMMAGVIPHSECDGIPTKRHLIDIKCDPADSRLAAREATNKFLTPKLGYVWKAPAPSSERGSGNDARRNSDRRAKATQTVQARKSINLLSSKNKQDFDQLHQAETQTALKQGSVDKDLCTRGQIRESSPQLYFADRPHGKIRSNEKQFPEKMRRTYSVSRHEMPRRRVITVEENPAKDISVRNKSYPFDWKIPPSDSIHLSNNMSRPGATRI